MNKLFFISPCGMILYASSRVVHILTTDYQKAFFFALGHSFLPGLTFHLCLLTMGWAIGQNLVHL